MKKQHILDRLEGLKLPMDSLEQIAREYEAWKPDKEEFREFFKLAALVTGVLKFPEKRSLSLGLSLQQISR
jgi:preprotein translocase subunit Sss1